MTLHPIPLNLILYKEKFIFFFLSVYSYEYIFQADSLPEVFVSNLLENAFVLRALFLKAQQDILLFFACLKSWRKCALLFFYPFFIILSVFLPLLILNLHRTFSKLKTHLLSASLACLSAVSSESAFSSRSALPQPDLSDFFRIPNRKRTFCIQDVL